MTTKLQLPKLTKKQKTKVYKWLSLLEYCNDYFKYEDSTLGYSMMVWIMKRLVRDYAFDESTFWRQVDEPKFHSAYNSDIRQHSSNWSKYLERLEADT